MSAGRRGPRRAVRLSEADRERAAQQRAAQQAGEEPVDARRQHPGTLPDRAAEDSDAAWNEPEDPEDDRLRRDVPPHW